MTKAKTRKTRGSRYGRFLVFMPVIALVTIIAVLALMWQPPSNMPSSGGVPVYLGTKKYADINITESEWSEVYNSISFIAGINDSVRIIFFGSTTCPHCHAQSEFFNATMPSRVVYLWIEDNDVGGVFYNLFKLEVSKGLNPNYAGGVPHMLVIDENKRLRAIVIGEAEDPAFWNILLS